MAKASLILVVFAVHLLTVSGLPSKEDRRVGISPRGAYIKGVNDCQFCSEQGECDKCCDLGRRPDCRDGQCHCDLKEARPLEISPRGAYLNGVNDCQFCSAQGECDKCCDPGRRPDCRDGQCHCD